MSGADDTGMDTSFNDGIEFTVASYLFLCARIAPTAPTAVRRNLFFWKLSTPLLL